MAASCSSTAECVKGWHSDIPVEAGQCLGTWLQCGSANEQWMAVGQAGSAAEHPSSSPPVTAKKVSAAAEGPALRRSQQGKQASWACHNLLDLAGYPLEKIHGDMVMFGL